MIPEDHKLLAPLITASVPTTVKFTYTDKETGISAERELEVYYFDGLEIKGLLPDTEDWRRFKCDQITNIRGGQKFKPRKDITVL